MTDHETLRSQLAADLGAFRKRGGRIETIPTGVSGDWFGRGENRADAANLLTRRHTVMANARRGSGRTSEAPAQSVARRSITGTDRPTARRLPDAAEDLPTRTWPRACQRAGRR